MALCLPAGGPMKRGPRFIPEEVCRRCKGKDIVTDHSEGAIICRGCGLVISDHIVDDRPFGDSGSVGLSLRTPKHNAQEQQLLGSKDMQVMASFGKRMKKRYYETMDKLPRFAVRLQLARKLTDRAIDIVEELYNTNKFPNKSATAVSGAALFLSCIHFESPRSIEELSTVTNLRKRELHRTIHIVKELLPQYNQSNDAHSALATTTSSAEVTTLPLTPPSVNTTIHEDIVQQQTTERRVEATDLIPRLAQSLHLPASVKDLAMAVGSAILAANLFTDKSAHHKAASSVYFVHFLFPRCGADPQKIAEAAKLGKPTLQRAHAQLFEHRMTLLPKDVIEKVGDSTLQRVLRP